MMPSPDQRPPGLFQKTSPTAQWGVLLTASLVFATILEIAGLPAALLLGPMLAGIVVGTNGGSIRAPRIPVLAAQTIVGCLVAHAITGDIVRAPSSRTGRCSSAWCSSLSRPVACSGGCSPG